MSAAVSVLFLDRLPSEAEHLKEMLVGNVLFVSKEQIVKTAILYSFIGLFHYIFRKKFMTLSFDASGASSMRYSRLWDFIFYCLFGVVVTSSVELAGVFLVFTFLIIPAVMAVLSARTMKGRIIFSWVSGVIMMAGLLLSAKMDTPTGATIVSVFGLALLLLWLLKTFWGFRPFN